MECHSVPLSSGIEAASGVIFPRSSMRMAIQPTPSFSKSQLIGMSRSLKASDLPPNSEVRSMGNLQSSRSMEDIRSTSSSDTDAQRDRPVITNYSPEGISSSRASAHDTPHVREREVRAIILTDGTPGDQELPLNEQVCFCFLIFFVL